MTVSIENQIRVMIVKAEKETNLDVLTEICAFLEFLLILLHDILRLG